MPWFMGGKFFRKKTQSGRRGDRSIKKVEIIDSRKLASLSREFASWPAWGQVIVALAVGWMTLSFLKHRLELVFLKVALWRAKRWKRKKPRWFRLGKTGKVACSHCYSPYVPTRQMPSCPTCGRDPYL